MYCKTNILYVPRAINILCFFKFKMPREKVVYYYLYTELCPAVILLFLCTNANFENNI